MGVPEQIDIVRGTLAAQGNKCAECGESLEFEDATKRGYSFDIICRPCAGKLQAQIVIFDEAADVDFEQVERTLNPCND